MNIHEDFCILINIKFMSSFILEIGIWRMKMSIWKTKVLHIKPCYSHSTTILIIYKCLFPMIVSPVKKLVNYQTNWTSQKEKYQTRKVEFFLCNYTPQKETTKLIAWIMAIFFLFSFLSIFLSFLSFWLNGSSVGTRRPPD